MVSTEGKKLTAKESTAIECYTNPVSETFNNWCQSYLKANYSKCTGWKHNAIKVLHKNYIIAEIARIRTEKAENSKLELDEIITNARYLTEMGIANSNGTDIGKGNEQLGKIIGAYKEVGINMNSDIPTDPIQYKAWLKAELDRMNNTDKVIKDYDTAPAAIAERY